MSILKRLLGLFGVLLWLATILVLIVAGKQAITLSAMAFSDSSVEWPEKLRWLLVACLVTGLAISMAVVTGKYWLRDRSRP